MKLSSDTLNVLKNFGSINSNIVFRTGNTIKTMSEAKNILAKVDVSETFPDRDFGIYDLNEFLGVVGMFDGQSELKFADDMNSVSIVHDNRSVKYFFSDPSILTSPSKDITMPPAEVSFTLTADDLSALRKAASTLGVSDLVVVGVADGAETKVMVTDVNDSTANSFEIMLSDTVRSAEPFNFVFNINNFKIVNGDYKVDISSRLISHFKHSELNLEYWIALEKNSTFGG